MSRVGKKPIKIPNDVKVEIKGNVAKITKGNINKEYNFGSEINADFKDGIIQLSPNPKFNKGDVAVYYGMHQRKVSNLVQGLTEPYRITLEINGVGFKSSVVKENLVLTLGYSHDIAFGLPKNVVAKVEGNLIHLDSDDKQLVGQIASEIISLRKPEPYKGKGVKIFGKPILRKEGKKK